MKTHSKFCLQNVVLFKRWKNKGYSILNSFGKIIIILALPVIYVSLSFNFAFSQNDTVNLNGIIINSQRKSAFANQNSKIVNVISSYQIKMSGSTNLSDLLDGTCGVDFQQRGANDVQADISIRGGNFDQTLILLNGTPISDPQTGHNSFNIPLPLSLIDKIEILQGPGTQIYGMGAYSGAINIITKDNRQYYDDYNALKLNFMLGQFSTFDVNSIIVSPSFSFGTSFKKSDGYFQNTDFKQINAFLKLNFDNSFSKNFFQFSAIANNFGAFNFYTPKFPYQHEIVTKIYTNFNSIVGYNERLNFNIYFNTTSDRFELFREGDDWYQHIGNYWIRNENDTARFSPTYFYSGHNFHRTFVTGVSLSSYFNSFFGKTNYGVNFQNNYIQSNVLGENSDTIKVNDIILTKSDNRTIFNIFADNTKKIGFADLSFGGNFFYNQKFGFYWTYAVDLTISLNLNNKIYSYANQGVRLPTFTDLYYNSATNIGNPELKPEKSTTYEIGYKHFSNNFTLQTAFFYRIGKNTIDWVKFDVNDLKWQTTNYTQVNTKGFQIAAEKFFTTFFIKQLKVEYSYIFQNKPQNNIISKYTLNYLKHNLSLSTRILIYKNIFVNLKFRYFERNGSFYTFENNTNIEHNFAPTWILDSKIIWDSEYFELYVNCSNIFDKKYYDLSYIELPGRWISAGFSLNIYRFMQNY